MTEFLQQEQDYLERYKSLVEEKLNWGNSADWRHHDFETLSEKIFAETGVMLSSTTLKRIWGKLKYDSIPNSNTLNALAAFIGHENWIAFKAKAYPSHTTESEPTQYTTKKHNSSKKAPLKWAAISLFVIAFIILALGIQRGKRNFSAAELSNITFTSTPVSQGIPNTVVFKYDVSHLGTDDVMIQQSWDKRLQFDIDADRHEVTSTYYFPGYFRAKLLVEGQIVKEHDLYIKSDGWLATLNTKPQPRYFLEEELIDKKWLGIKEDIVLEAQSKAAEPPVVVGFHYVDDFGDLQSDHFTMEASFKNTYDKGDGVCQFSKIVVLCTDGAFLIPFSIPGCTGDIRLVFNDVVQLGKENDLTAFGCDFSDWQDFKLEVEDREVTMSLNGQPIHSLTYQENAGRVVGFRFLFAGNGEVDNVRLLGADGALAFEEGFEK